MCSENPGFYENQAIDKTQHTAYSWKKPDLVATYDTADTMKWKASETRSCLGLYRERPRPAHSCQRPATPMSVGQDQREECRSLSHLGIFMPLYLLPLLFLGHKTAGATWFSARHRDMCARFGLRRGPLFAAVCACSFFCSWFFSSTVASVVLMYFLDRVLTTTFKEGMDQPRDDAVLWTPFLPRQLGSASTPAAPSRAGDELLFGQLAQMVVSTEKPMTFKERFKRKRTAEDASNRATEGVTVRVTVDSPPVKLSSGQWNDGTQWAGSSPSHKADKKERKAPYFRWPLGWRKKENETIDSQARPQMSTTAANTGAGPSTDDRERLGHTTKIGESTPAKSMPSSTAPDSQASASKADEMTRSRKGPIGIMKPFALVRSNQQIRRQQQEPQQLPSSKPTSAESKTDAQIPVHSTEATRESTKQPQQVPYHHDPHAHELSSKQRGDSRQNQHSTTGSTSPNSSHFQWLHKLRVFWSTAGSKRAAEDEPREGNAPCATSETRVMPPAHQVDPEVRGLPSSEMSECPIGRNTPPYSLVPTNRAPATNDDPEDGGKDTDAKAAFVFDALADRLDLAAEAFITAAAGAANELGVSIPGAESEDSVTPATNSVSPTVPGGCEAATCTTRAAFVTAFDAAAAALPTHVQKMDDSRGEKRESQGDEASGTTQSRKRPRKIKEGKGNKKKQGRKSTGSSNRSSRRTSGRSSGRQTPRLSHKSDPQAKGPAPVVVAVMQQEEQPGVLKNAEELRKAAEHRCPVAPQEPPAPGGSTAQPEDSIAEAPGCARDAERDNLHNKGSSQLSKSSLQKSRGPDRENQKSSDAATEKGTAGTTKTGQQESCAKKKTADQHVDGSRPTLSKKATKKG
ncbi:hypothetical protein HPB52_015004 [Rhipicephalus sanguineus]|uniref:Transmembrane protein n=1 Tax=Rhipicephalus sanguineus TaxID=34632 RepID=A0A9D4PXN1_RHISA|nr:hypothetical protein HPB52_015004 [Rhipicephalus sanguineus]